ncbi:MAG: molybdenum cofactor biosysynthesis protein [Verrucomicrobia bacterium]|nr:MAG: molybdenum cofactor biosysynthesis protein [Verrucomicrobiota bacterium]
MSQSLPITIHRLLICPEHIYVGHHGRPPGETPLEDLDAARCIAGKGLSGDRYAGREEGHKRQATFFDLEVHRDLCRRFPEAAVGPDVYRRNVVIEGVDLNSLIGKQFRLGEVLFEGVEECRPCYWMDSAFGPGAEEALKGKGGLRARILEGGTLQKGTQDLIVLDPD